LQVKLNGTLAAVKPDSDMGSGVLGQVDRLNAQEKDVEQFVARTGTSAPAHVHNFAPFAPNI
ncbi:MAG TPA: hypothetical protein VFS88_02465, partial [Micavibrio sp.]|nr:hypothetical protein [Micavibrio sp.]